MQGYKGAIVVASIIAFAATLGACRHDRHEPMKLGAADVTVEQQAVVRRQSVNNSCLDPGYPGERICWIPCRRSNVLGGHGVPAFFLFDL